MKANNFSLITLAGERKYLTKHERQAFLDAARSEPTQDYYLARILALTGCRLTEALRLRRSQVDAHNACLVLETLKQRQGNRYRLLPIPEDFAALLGYWLEHEHRKRDTLFPMHRQSGWRKIKKIMHNAGLSGKHATCRGLRHGFAIACIEAGAHLTQVQKWLGHSSIKTTTIYTEFVGPDERAIAERVWAQAV